MVIGTTPILVFKGTENISAWDKVYLTFAQRGTPVIIKEKADLTFSTEGQKYVVTCSLTQQETMKFDDRVKADIQFRVCTNGGYPAKATKKYSVDLFNTLQGGVIS